MNKTFYFQSNVARRTLHAIRKYDCGHFYLQTWVQGEKVHAKRVKVNAAEMVKIAKHATLISER